jgi:hypothetical protein
MVESDKDLEKTYGPSAPYSEHKRGERINYLRADGIPSSGVIEWIQAAYEDVPIKYIIAPDDGGFLDFALPSDVITQEQDTPSDTLTRCPYCNQIHPAHQIEQCPMKPGKE